MTTTYSWPYFTRATWFALPYALRRRWWQETEYGRKPPSKELLDACTHANVAT